MNPQGIEDRSKLTTTTIVVIAANLLPLAGVLFWGWSTVEILTTYWFETLVIGILNIPKILICHPVPGQIDYLIDLKARLKEVREQKKQAGAPFNEERWQRTLARFERESRFSTPRRWLSKLYLVPFFILHFGGFILVLGLFLGLIFLLTEGRPSFLEYLSTEGSGAHQAQAAQPQPPVSPEPLATSTWSLLEKYFADAAFLLALALFAGRHLYDFFYVFLFKGTYRRVLPSRQVVEPYPRVIVIHLAIFFGGAISALFGSPIFLLVALVVFKLYIELAVSAARREQKKYVQDQGTSPAEEPGAG